MDKYQRIIKRVFGAMFPRRRVVVVFGSDETVTVRIGSMEYRMVIGSDDDGFFFRRVGDQDDVIQFPYPSDWF